MTVRDLVLRLHRWGGLAIGLLVAVVSLTGAALLINLPAQQRGADEAARVTPGEGPRVAPSALIAAGEAALEGRELRAAQFYADPSHAAVMHFWDEARVFVDPWTGDAFGAEETPAGSALLERFHRSLLLSGPGTTLVGLVTVGLVVLVVFGLWLWWPGRGSIKRAFRPEVRRGWKRANYDLHNVLGFYAAALLLVLGGTGALMAYPGLQTLAGRAVQAVFGDGHPSGQLPAELDGVTPLPAESDRVASTPRVDRAIAHARRLFPDATWVQALPARGGRPGLRILVAADRSGNASRYHTLRADAAGDIQSLTRFGEERRVVRLNRLVGRLHTGEGMGPIYRVSAFLACVIGGLLPFSGTLIWFPRWRRRRQRGG